MLKRIDVIDPKYSRYQVLNKMTDQLSQALRDQGVDVRKMTKEDLLYDPPDCTLCFNGLLPDDQGNFLSDMLKIPHIACLVDSPHYYLELTKSAYTIIGCIDRFHDQMLDRFSGTSHFFFPHAADEHLSGDPRKERPYDIAMAASFMDPDALYDSWKDKFPKEVKEALELAASSSLSNLNISLEEALMEQLKNIQSLDLKSLNYALLMTELEYYIRGLDRKNTLDSLKDFNVHVFGEGWEVYKGPAKVHKAIPFTETLEVMKKSKIVLNCSPHIKDGGHERFFSSYLLGALPISGKNLFLSQDYDAETFYETPHWSRLPDLAASYLSDERKRIETVEKGKETTLKKHTWKQRAELLLEEASLFIDEL